MKKFHTFLLILIVFSCWATGASAQNVTFTDASLAAVVRTALGLSEGVAIPQAELRKLRRLDAVVRNPNSGIIYVSGFITGSPRPIVRQHPMQLAPITNLTGLEQATALESLWLRYHQISDITPLAGLTQLEALNLPGCPITSISALTNLTRLTFLRIGGDQIRDITPLTNLTQLTDLGIGGDQIRDISTLANLTQLHTLLLHGSQISDISVLTNLTQLRHLSIEQSAVSDISTLANLTQLGVLWLNENSISDISVLARLTNLRWVRLDFNQIRDISALAGLTNLTTLRLVHNQISDITPLTNLTQLITLELEGNPIGDTTPLVALTNLERLDIDADLNLNPKAPRILEISLVGGNLSDVPVGHSINVVVMFEGKETRHIGNLPDNLPYVLVHLGAPTPESERKTVSHSTEDAKSTKVTKHPPPAPVILVGEGNRPPMYWIDTKTGTLHRLTGDKAENLVPSAQKATSLAVDVATGKLYWAEKTGERTGRIRRANLDGNPNVQLVKNLTSVPQGIALDGTNGKIYVTNAWGKVQRLNVDGSNFEPNLITGLDAPKSLTLDVPGGKVYWTEGSGRIRRANLDGSKIETVVTDLATPMDIAIFGNTLYWAEKTGENRGEIRYAHLNGNRSAGIHTTFQQGFPVGIAVDGVEHMLYWTTSLGNIDRSALDGSTPQENVVTGLDAPGILAVQVKAPKAPEIPTPEIRATDALVRISPSSVISPAVGEQLTVNLNITAGEAVAGYQVTVGFDATALRYVESSNGTYLPTGAFFVPPVINRGRVELAATALAGVSNGDGTLATITFEVMEVKASTLTVSEPLLADNQANTFRPRVEGGEITEPPELTADVNGDGTVNIQDLVLVASSFGKAGQTAADVNGDGVVNIADLVLVAGGLNTGAGAPALVPGTLEMLTAADVQAWLSQAYQLDSRYAGYQRGVSVLEHLLAALTPQATALLPNYPNPFNPETWIPYQLAHDSEVKISIYDARGSVVRVLTLGHQSAGYYTNRSRAAYWDGRNTFGERVASGVYFYQLQAGNVSSLRKMTILK